MPVESLKKMSTWFLKIRQWSRVEEAKGSLLSPLSLLAKYLKNETNKILLDVICLNITKNSICPWGGKCQKLFLSSMVLSSQAFLHVPEMDNSTEI